MGTAPRSASTVKLVSASRCRMWRLHDRLEEHITAEACVAEIRSFPDHGQLVPVLGRPLTGDPQFDIELIYGARRLYVARHVDMPLLVELREISDRDAVIAMDIENRQRVDVSPYERGLSYARWLHSGVFGSQDEIAEVLKVSASQVSRLLKMARLPRVVTAAFASPVDICEGWGQDLVDAFEDPQRTKVLVKKARVLASVLRRPPALEVYRRLIADMGGNDKPKSLSRDQVVKDCRGTPLFRVRHQIHSVALVLPSQAMSADLLMNICNAVSGILQGGIPQVIEDVREAPSRSTIGARLSASRNSSPAKAEAARSRREACGPRRYGDPVTS
jgi:ParB family transcriptional regulator, chromosome partitioning protein